MKHTIQEAFIKFSNSYLNTYKLSYDQKKVFENILKCRTSKLGYHIYQCDNCDNRYISYNSCKDRHCPNCQNFRKEVWIDNHTDDILDINYFHTVMTVPSELHPIFYHNQEEMYSFLFRVSSEVIKELSEDKKYLGAKVGITSMLHTWSQKGNYHPHVHMIITGGGLTESNEWKDAKEDFFIPVKVISRKFRGKLLAKIKECKNLKFYGQYEYLNDKAELNKYLSPLYEKEWVCYCKPPFNNVGEVYQYLGKYAFRVCMSNERLIDIDDEYVTFSYKDHNDRSKTKSTKVHGEEFIRRFLLHVLPKSFMKIRYYGLLSGKNKNERMELLRILTNTKRREKRFKDKISLINKLLGRDITKCCKCSIGNMLLDLTVSEVHETGPPVSEGVKLNKA